MNLTNYQKKALDIYHNHGPEKAWNYWKLTGHDYGIFLGEVFSNEFISGNDLINYIGLTDGVSQHSDTPWLKFILDSEIIILPMKPIMHSVSWEHIYQAGAVYGTDDVGTNPSGGNRLQDARITINGNNYKIALLKGANSDPTTGIMGWDIPLTHNSEWNRLMYPIHGSLHAEENNLSSPSIPYNQWASYSDSDLLVHHYFGDGAYNRTQQFLLVNNNQCCILRGRYGVSFSGKNTPNTKKTKSRLSTCFKVSNVTYKYSLYKEYFHEI